MVKNREACCGAVHGVAKSRTPQNDWNSKTIQMPLIQSWLLSLPGDSLSQIVIVFFQFVFFSPIQSPGAVQLGLCDLSFPPGIEFRSMAIKGPSPNHWIVSKFPLIFPLSRLLWMLVGLLYFYINIRISLSNSTKWTDWIMVEIALNMEITDTLKTQSIPIDIFGMYLHLFRSSLISLSICSI